jgi:hypothetical protein
MFVYARKVFEKIPHRGLVSRWIPAMSALLIAAIGFGIVLKALTEVGFLVL